MKQFLDTIRMAKPERKLSKKIVYSVAILFLGMALGIFAKWLDSIAIDDTIWWQYILGIFDLRNVFSEFAIWLVIALAISIYSRTPLRASWNVFLFFAGMCSSYHLYTIVICGFNPKRYMMIWYTITLLSPILAFLCWYGKGETKISLLLDTLILSIMVIVCFSVGFWYFDFHSVVDTLLFVISVFLLYSTPKHTILSLIGSVILAYSYRIFL